MAPRPELENAQTNPNTYTEGAGNPQHPVSEKDKESGKSVSHASSKLLGGAQGVRADPKAHDALCTDDSRASATRMEMLPSYSTMAHIDDPPETDPWDLPELQDMGPKWSEQDARGKLLCVFQGIGKFILLLGFLYLFVCSLDVLSSAFQLVGGKVTKKFFRNNLILSNPLGGLGVGVLVTALIQSSSTSSSLIISMVASSMLTVRAAIPIIMGASIGTCITSTIVALLQAKDRNEFKRAFAGAALDDFFSSLTVLVLLPLEATTHFLEILSHLVLETFHFKNGGYSPSRLKVIIEPFTKLIIQLDKSIINEITFSDKEAPKKSLIKIWCKTSTNTTLMNVTVPLPENCTSPAFCWTNGFHTWTFKNVTYQENIEKCHHIFVNLNLPDLAVGIILVILSLLVLCGCLILIVKILGSVLKGKMVVALKSLNTDLPFPFSWMTGYLAILVGASLTFLMQSSSMFTSAMTPLIGLGVISIERAYSLTLGSSIASITTTILAALASPGNKLRSSLQIALCHFFFYIFGFLLWYPIPFTRLPIHLAKGLGNISAQYRWFAVVYIIVFFFLIPLAVFGLSLTCWQVLAVVGVTILFMIVLVVITGLLQSRCPGILPRKLQNWDFLPLWLHSLKPWDEVVSRYTSCFQRHGNKCCDKQEKMQDLKSPMGMDNLAMSKEVSDETHLSQMKNLDLSNILQNTAL